ncbi:29 kDa protein [Tobacco rattle virus]|uniref:Movement protein n=2 Tax=Tobacco rattle virus TaxID=12295 RepID=MVP_TRVPP|nr:29 kDa protein [Tobacco rattle virus]Q9QPN4.1 RecName: Full=Movement protein; AltName: Full=29 kDa protein; AltName: Full=Cell-to-cell transport protein; AltName: Full=P1a [Tobacco rattle virus PpK20]AAD48028.1 29 kDa protein [Tobacco rattle virus]AAM50510.1 movement protein [Tobacco rattle virus]
MEDKSLVTLKKKTFEVSKFSNLGAIELFVDGRRKRPKYFHRRRETVLNHVGGKKSEHKLDVFDQRDYKMIKSYAFLKIVGVQLVVTSHLPADTPGFIQIDLLDSRLTEKRKRGKTIQRFKARACDNCSVAQYKVEYSISTQENVLDVWKVGCISEGVPVCDGTYPFSIEVSLIWVATDSTRRLNVEELNSSDYIEGDFTDQEVFGEFMSLKQVEMKTIEAKYDGPYRPATTRPKSLLSSEDVKRASNKKNSS